MMSMIRLFGHRDRVSEDFIRQVIIKEKTTRHEANQGDSVDGENVDGIEVIPKRERSQGIKRGREEFGKVARAGGRDVKASFVIEDPIEDESGEKKMKPLQKDQVIHYEPIKILSESNKLIESQYGALKLPAFFKLSSLTNIYYLVNSSNINFILKVLKNDKTSLLLFPHVITINLDYLRKECKVHF